MRRKLGLLFDDLAFASAAAILGVGNRTLTLKFLERVVSIVTVWNISARG